MIMIIIIMINIIYRIAITFAWWGSYRKFIKNNILKEDTLHNKTKQNPVGMTENVILTETTYGIKYKCPLN